MQNNNVSHTQMSNLSPSEFDYTFTDKELQDILGFMEHQACGPDASVTSAPPPFLTVPPPSGLGLQFQPHPAPVQSGSRLAVHPYDQTSTARVKGEVASSSTGFAPVIAGATAPLVGGHARTRSGACPAATLNLSDRHLQQIQGTATNRQDRGQPIATCDFLSSCCWRLHLSDNCTVLKYFFGFGGLQSQGNTSVIAQLKNNAETESTH